MVFFFLSLDSNAAQMLIPDEFDLKALLKVILFPTAPGMCCLCTTNQAAEFVWTADPIKHLDKL